VRQDIGIVARSHSPLREMPAWWRHLSEDAAPALLKQAAAGSPVAPAPIMAILIMSTPILIVLHCESAAAGVRDLRACRCSYRKALDESLRTRVV